MKPIQLIQEKRQIMFKKQSNSKAGSALPRTDKK